MKLIIDTNVVFSTLLNPYSLSGEILMNIQDEFSFFAPQLLLEELERYALKIARYSKIAPKDIKLIKRLVLANINLVQQTNLTKL